MGKILRIHHFSCQSKTSDCKPWFRKIGRDFFLKVESVQFSDVQLFATPWTAARRASLCITNSRSLLKLVSIESVMPSNHLTLCCPLFLPPSIFPSIRVFSNESVLHIRWPKYWRFSFSISPSSEYSGLISCKIDWFRIYCQCLLFNLPKSY